MLKYGIKFVILARTSCVKSVLLSIEVNALRVTAILRIVTTRSN